MKMADIIERIALAMCEADGGGWDDCFEPRRQMFRKFASNALAAMREPTDRMTASGGMVDDSDGYTSIGESKARQVWETMINEALSSLPHHVEPKQF